MLKIKFGQKELSIKYAYIATVKSGILKKLVKLSSYEDNFDRIQAMMELIPELVLVGVQKYHRDEFGYNYDTNEGWKEQLDKVYELVDDYFDSPDSDEAFLLEDLQNELMDNSFLAKMFREEQKKVEKKDKEKTA